MARIQKNIRILPNVLELAEGYAKELSGFGADVSLSQVVEAGIVLFMDLGEDERIEAISRGRNLDLTQMKQDAGDHMKGGAKKALGLPKTTPGKRPKGGQGHRQA